MTRLNSTLGIVALLALSAFPATIAGQAPASSSSPSPAASKSTATITVEVDPWLPAWRREHTQSRIARLNLRTLNDALEPYRMSYADLSDSERSGIRSAFADVLPGQRFTTYKLNAPQARAIVYLALGPARGRRDRCEHARQPEPAPVQAGEPSLPSWCDAALDTMSRNAAWIHTTILSVGRSGAARRSKAEELDDLRSMAERARDIVISTPRCGCRLGDDADALLTSTREAVDAVAASSVPAWMTLRGEQVQRIATLSNSVERLLLRCLSSR
jgi:hypothetical protein